jgi:hypothetical protein
LSYCCTTLGQNDDRAVSREPFHTEAEMAVDTDIRSNRETTYLDRRLMRGSVVLMTGGMLAWLIGATVGTVTVVTACRRYVAGLDEPPQVKARRRWQQARSATLAGVGAWQDYGRQSRRRPDG